MPTPEELKASILEGDEFLVVGVVMPSQERWATLYRAESARQAEDLARAAIRVQARESKQEGELWVAGVVWLDPEGHLAVADTYATFVNPDTTTN